MDFSGRMESVTVDLLTLLEVFFTTGMHNGHNLQVKNISQLFYAGNNLNN